MAVLTEFTTAKDQAPSLAGALLVFANLTEIQLSG